MCAVYFLEAQERIYIEATLSWLASSIDGDAVKYKGSARSRLSKRARGITRLKRRIVCLDVGGSKRLLSKQLTPKKLR